MESSSDLRFRFVAWDFLADRARGGERTPLPRKLHNSSAPHLLSRFSFPVASLSQSPYRSIHQELKQSSFQNVALANVALNGEDNETTKNRAEMGTSALFSSGCCFALWSDCFHRPQVRVRRAAAAGKSGGGFAEEGSEMGAELLLRRRTAVVSGLSLVSSVSLGFPGEGLAVKQGLLPGRIPGLSEPDENGWMTYRRPDDKSGGHGVGWSPIIPYVFKVPKGWGEVPVSIADLGGTEIDLRFASSKEGRLFVIVAPVLRFADLGEDVTMEKIGPPEKVINAFGPEVIGENVEGKVLSMEVAKHSGRTYYQYELEPPHVLITATAAGNRLYLFNITANGLQWKKHYKGLKQIADSFRVI